ncbi:MAG: site-specific integrase [Desulfovibrio sp.]|nr:site-specific integrase [Desulfovibrio sp.]
MAISKHCGKWQAKIRRKGYPQQIRTFQYKSEAEAWEREILAEMDRGVFVSRTEAEATTLGDLLQRYLDECVPKLRDAAREANRVKALMRRPIASRIVATIRSSDIAEFIRSRQGEGVGGNTIRLDVAVLSKLFNVASTEWGFESIRNPTEKVRKPTRPRGRDRRIRGPQEWRALLKAANPRFRLVLRFAVRTAMRREEIAGLTWDCVSMTKRTVYLPRTKNGEARTVPLSPRAWAILRQAGPAETGSVFGMTVSAITQAMHDTRRRAGISDLHFHDLRHEATSRLFELTDLEAMEIRSITGHKTMQMLLRYSHLRTERLVARLAGARRGTPNTHGPNVVAFRESAR